VYGSLRTRHYLLTLLVVPLMVKVMYPTEQCIDLATENQHWHDDFANDTPYAQCVSSLAQIHFDVIKSHDPLSLKLFHTSNSIGRLRKQIAEPNLVVTDSLIFTVVALTLMSEASNELGDALTHLRGLKAMIDLRGGIGALARKRSLQIKCCRSVYPSFLHARGSMLIVARIDLALAMRTGNNPLFFDTDSLTWKPYLADQIKGQASPWHALVDAPDIRLVNVWLDLREFTMSVNLARQTKRKISPVLFQEVLISVQYRLHHLDFSSHDPQETLRLTMLAFSASLFLDVHSHPLRYEQLASALRKSLQAFPRKDDRSCLELELWLLFIARMAVLNTREDQPWLEQRLRATARDLRVSTRAEVRQVLKGFLWVDMLHNRRTEAICDTTKSLDIVHPG